MLLQTSQTSSFSNKKDPTEASNPL
jgi:hypothetical protein